MVYKKMAIDRKEDMNRRRPAVAGHCIIQPDEILSRDSIIDAAPLNYTTITNIAKNDQDKLIEWLVKHRLLRNSLDCSNCNVPMSYIKRTDVSDGRTWRCKTCRKTKSIRIDSFFTPSQLPLRKIFLIIYGWARNLPLQEIALDAEVNKTSTITDWANHLRKIWPKSKRKSFNLIIALISDQYVV